MKLTERLSDIKFRLSSTLQNIRDSLLIKGVVTPEDLTYSLVPKYIRQVYQSDFEFVFNFRDIDQFGSPHVPNTGQSIGGMRGIVPIMNDLIIPEYNFTTTFDFQDTISVSGHEYWSDNPPLETILDQKLIFMEDFNEQTMPEELNYDPTLVTT